MSGARHRRTTVASLYRRGHTNVEIARRLGVSKERVRQLLQQYEIAVVPVAERRYLAAVEGREDEIVAAFVELHSDAAVARRLGLREQHVHRLIDARLPEAGVLRRRPRRRPPRYTDDELLVSLREAALELPSPMGYHAYRIWAGQRERDGHPCPGPQVAQLRFGSWRRALVRAGLPANRAGGPRCTFAWPDVVTAVAACWRELGQSPSVARYETWRAGRAGLPSPATVRRQVASWNDLLVAAYPLVYGPPAQA